MRKTDVWKIGKKTIAAIAVFAMVFSVFVGMNAQNVSAVNADKGIKSTVDVMAGTTPTIDGTLAGQWADTTIATIDITVTGGATAHVYLKHDGTKLYVGFDVPDATGHGESSDYVAVLLDTDNSKEAVGQPDSGDFRLSINREDVASEAYVYEPDGWNSGNLPVDWTGEATSTSTAWSAEYAIDYAKLEVTAGTAKTIGFDVLIKDGGISPAGFYYWHSSSEYDDYNRPSTWGNATSSDDWLKVPKGWLEGYTVDEAGAPVANVGIWIYGGAGKYYMTVSNDTGRYKSNNTIPTPNTGIPVGDYSVLGIDLVTGNLSETLFAIIEEDTLNELDITLHKAPPAEVGGSATFKDEFANITPDSFFTMSIP